MIMAWSWRTRIFFRPHFAIARKSLWRMYTALAESAKEKQLTEGPSLIIFACKKRWTNYRLWKVITATKTRRGLKMKTSKWAAKVTFFYFFSSYVKLNLIEIRMIFNVLLTNILRAPGFIIIGSRSEAGRFVIGNPCLHLFTFTCIGSVKSLRYHTNRF